MRRSLFHRFAKNESAAIAPLYALGIGTLVVMSAVGFDYGRLMALDTELQNAADQAALAAATQLDGTANAMINARNAANNTFASATSQFTNQTRFANDGQGRPITSLSYRFFNGYTNDAMGTQVTSDANGAQAQVVEVTVNARRVFYALTPLVGAFTSGDVIGRALAGLESATCNVPPMMFCLPTTGGVADTGYPRATDVGAGVALHFKSNGPDSPGNPNDGTTDDGSTWAPGNFGFLDLDYFTGNQNRTTGLNSDVLGCTGTPPISDPGFRTPQGSALNSRFDLYPPPTNSCNTSTGDFCPAQNVRKNLVYRMQGNPSDCNNPPNNFVDNRWVDPTSVGLADPGYPKDAVQASNPNLAYGDANWGASTWFAATHPSGSFSEADLNSDGRLTRYEVYQWELNPSFPSRLNPSAVMTGTDGEKYCAFNRPADEPPGVPATSTQKDRRILTVAAVDCTDLNGKEQVKIMSWVDMFLVQPVKTSGSDRDFYSEIAGPARRANGNLAFQYFGRKKAVLIR
jgi:Flp pilus assembly protein TadG